VYLRCPHGWGELYERRGVKKGGKSPMNSEVLETSS